MQQPWDSCWREHCEAADSRVLVKDLGAALVIPATFGWSHVPGDYVARSFDSPDAVKAFRLAARPASSLGIPGCAPPGGPR